MDVRLQKNENVNIWRTGETFYLMINRCLQLDFVKTSPCSGGRGAHAVPTVTSPDAIPSLTPPLSLHQEFLLISGVIKWLLIIK